MQSRSNTPLILLLIAVLTIFILLYRITTPSTSSSNLDEEILATTKSRLLLHSSSSTATMTRKTNLLVSKKKETHLLNGVILYLYGGRWHDYFVQHALPRLDEYFLSCYPYPVMVFHEAATQKQKMSIIKALPKGQQAYSSSASLKHQQEDSGIVIFDD